MKTAELVGPLDGILNRIGWPILNGIGRPLDDILPRKTAVEEQLSDHDRWRRKHRYGQRWMVESAISYFKRAFGEHVTLVKWRYMVNELLLQASVYNIFMTAKA